MSEKHILASLKTAKKIYMQFPNCIGVGRGIKKKDGILTGDVSIVFFVTNKVLRSNLKVSEIIPQMIKGIITDVQTMKLPEAPRPIPEKMRKRTIDKTAKHRPAPAGVSIGHHAITAGTQGWYAKDLKGETNEILGLSNNHVKANENLAKIGDDIWQPGPHDNGGHVFEHLFRFVPVNLMTESTCPSVVLAKLYNLLSSGFGRHARLIPTSQVTNEVDAALGIPIEGSEYVLEIADIGLPNGKNYNPELQSKGMKSGRTTCRTNNGILIAKDWMGTVAYSRGIAIFDKQYVYEGQNFSAGGDSGSIVLDHNKNITGLLFAGSEQQTIVNPVEAVERLLEISLIVP